MRATGPILEQLVVLAGIAAAAAWFGAAGAEASDWPSLRGPNHNGISDEKGWLDAWPEGAKPRVLWKASVGKGHSAVSVSRGLAYTMGWAGGQDTLFCFDAATGTVKWKASYACGDRKQYSGPRATPTVDGDTVYTLSQRGHLRAWHAGAGDLRWHKDLPESYNPDEDYGHAWSPLVQGNLLILSAGRKGLAIHKATGEFAWGNDGYRGTCASAVPYDAGGRPGVVVACTDKETLDVVGVDAVTGAELWRYAGWPEKYGAFSASPIVRDGKVFITSGQEYRKCARLSIRGSKADKDWETRALGSNTGQCVYLNGYVYGVDCSRKTLVCVNWNDGARVWEQKGFGAYGNLMAADGRLLVQSNEGRLVIVQADPAGYRELRRADALVGETFTAPVLANGRIYCRDYEGNVVCLAGAR
ncbi:MAG: PQQ-binding-like beta-propeller repeat protein [Planctomycetes bacterium]|nr:PQQ-binding-like beta-propeller repeat protein [Planctomycetota bacterium]